MSITHLSASNLCYSRQNKLLFENVSFTLNPGELLLVEGPNGSGKSSLLRILSGLAMPTAGDVYWRGNLIQSTRIEYAEHLHYIGHANGIKLGLSVAENLQLIGHLSLASALDLDNVLSTLQLNSYKHSLAKNLSAGQRRRIALAKLFLLPKSLWILDEPFTALDTTIQAVFLLKLEEHLQQGGIAMISSHHAIHLAKHKPQRLRLGLC